MTGPRYEVKHTEGGKGSTTETNTFEAHQSFAILICESCELRDSTIVGIQMVRCNGKIVYDVRPGSTMLAESAKWKEKVEFYFGAEDQMPDPTMEAIFGVGDTPYMRGYCYAVFRDFNRSEFGDAIPQFEWVVVSEGTVAPESESYAAGRLSGFQNAHWPLTDGGSDYTYTGFWIYGVGGGIASDEFDSIAEVQAWAAGLNASNGTAGTNILGSPAEYIGYMGITDSTEGGGPYNGSTAFDLTGVQPDVTDFESLLLLYQWIVPSSWSTSVAIDMCGEVVLAGDWIGAVNGVVLRKVSSHSTNYLDVALCGSDHLEGIYPLLIEVKRKRIPPAINGISVPDLPGWYVDADGHLFTGYTEITDTFKVLAKSHITGSDPMESYNQYEVGPAVRTGDANYSNSAFWTAAYNAAVIAGTVPAGWTYGSQYPVTVTSAWLENADDPPVVATDRIALSTIVQRINRRGGLTDADVDVTELTDLVIGYPIAAQYNAADCIRPLAACYFFKGSEYDGKIHFHKDGSDALIVVDPDDFIIGSDEIDEDKRGQAKEYPRLITGSYIAPSLDFAVGKTKAERRSPDVRAIGEQTLQIPVCMDDDEAQQATDKAMKIMWAKQQGKRKFSVPYATAVQVYLGMTPCIPFGLDGKRYVVDQLTINDGQLDIEASYDRQSAYTSNVTAIPRLPPTPPVSTIFGPTIVAIMQLPQLRAGETPPGLYFGACGVLANWPGCQILISFDGGENYQPGPRITVASVIGNLTADVAAEGSNSEPILVAINNGELVNVTDAQFDSGANGFAMVDADDVWEVGRFKSQDELSPLNYSVTDVTRGDLLTIPVDHVTGQQFVMLANAVFWPIDPAFAGQTLYVKPVTFGTDPALTEVYTVVYNPDLDVIVDGGGD
jgi:hypothetical protein